MNSREDSIDQVEAALRQKLDSIFGFGDVERQSFKAALLFKKHDVDKSGKIGTS